MNHSSAYNYSNFSYIYYNAYILSVHAVSATTQPPGTIAEDVDDTVATRQVMNQDNQVDMQTNASPTQTSLTLNTSADAPPIPICIVPPPEVTQMVPQTTVSNPPESSVSGSSVGYPPSMEFEAPTSCEPIQQVMNQDNQFDIQTNTSPSQTSLRLNTSADVPPIPICVDSPPEVTQMVPQAAVSNLPESVSASSVDYPPSMEFEAPTSCEPIPTGYQLKLPAGHEIRDYQRELAGPGIRGENYIFVAPTGSGKTLVTAIIIAEHLKKVQASGDIAKVVFLVHTKPLADQQCATLQSYVHGARVECVVGDSNGTIKNALTQCEIVVCTTGKFLNELSRDMVSLALPSEAQTDKTKITLVVMDECHHARKSSFQAQVMFHYISRKVEDPSAQLPQIVGLTASPGAGDNPNLDTTKTIDHLVNLCALLDATSGIVTVQQNVANLERFVRKPTLSQEIVSNRSQSERFVCLIEEEMIKLEQDTPLKTSFPKWSQNYETVACQAKQPLELSTNPKFRDQISTLKLLVCYCQALKIYMDLRQEDAIKVLEDFEDLPDEDHNSTKHEQTLKKGLHTLTTKLNTLQPVENPLLQRAKECINEQFQNTPKSRGVFFVHTKRHAFAVCKWLQSLHYNFLQPIVITGHGDSGMTQSSQQDAMKNFRSGNNNILVSTSVAEEGLDVPACNFVIRFQHVSNEIATAQTQGRARAEESEVITILSSDSSMNMKEIQNSERLELVNKIIKNNWFPNGKILHEKLIKQQKLVIHKRNIKELVRAQRRRLQSRSGDGGKIKLRCKKCKTIACFGSDIFTAEGSSHHVVPGEDIKDKLVEKPHHKPVQLYESVIKTHKIYCKDCDTDWGIMCIWPVEGFKFPVLKCKSFVFQDGNGRLFPVAQWSKAPFEPLPLDVWIAEHSQSPDEALTN